MKCEKRTKPNTIYPFLFLFSFFFFLSSFVSAQTTREVKIFVSPVSGGGNMGDAVYFYKQLTYEVILQYHSLVRDSNDSDYNLIGTITPYTGVPFSFFNDTIEPIEPIEQEVTVEPEIVQEPRSARSRQERQPRIHEFYSSERNAVTVSVDPEAQDEPEEPAAYEPEEIIEEEYQDSEIIETYEFDEFVLSLELQDSTGTVIGHHEIIYYSADSTLDDLVSVAVYYLLSGIPGVIEEPDWRDKLLFASASLIWAPRLYKDIYESISFINWGIGLQAEFHFLPFLAVGTGMDLVMDWVVVSRNGNDEYIDMVIEFPLYLKGVFKLSDSYMLEPYAGLKFNVSMLGKTKPCPISWHGGIQFGFKAGPGMVTIDPRFSMDIKESSIPNKSQEYMRYMLNIGIGYKMGFFTRR